MEFKLGEITYPVEIIRKKNKNTYIRVKNGVISVSTNPFITKKQIDRLLLANQEAIQKMILKCQREEEKKQKFYILGHIYDIIVVSGINHVEVSKNTILTPNLRTLELWYQKEIRRLYSERLTFWYNTFEENIPIPKLKIRDMKTRWGVCNIRDNSITLNRRLMTYDQTKLDYVIIHELSHFKHFNHSADFWALVRKYCPEYKQIRKALKEE